MIYYDYLVINSNENWCEDKYIEVDTEKKQIIKFKSYLNLDNTNTDYDLKLDINFLCYDKDFKLVNNFENIDLPVLSKITPLTIRFCNESKNESKNQI